MLAAGALVSNSTATVENTLDDGGIGLVAGASLFIYLPIFHQGSEISTVLALALL